MTFSNWDWQHLVHGPDLACGAGGLQWPGTGAVAGVLESLRPSVGSIFCEYVWMALSKLSNFWMAGGPQPLGHLCVGCILGHVTPLPQHHTMLHHMCPPQHTMHAPCCRAHTSGPPEVSKCRLSHPHRLCCLAPCHH